MPFPLPRLLRESKEVMFCEVLCKIKGKRKIDYSMTNFMKIPTEGPLNMLGILGSRH